MIFSEAIYVREMEEPPVKTIAKLVLNKISLRTNTTVGKD